MSARAIKKYPNRRLYDTEQSKYVTLDELRELVEAGEAIKVSDARSGEDLTRQTLLQIILEQECCGKALLNEQTLSKMIAMMGAARPSALSPLLEATVDALDKAQKSLQKELAEPAAQWMSAQSKAGEEMLRVMRDSMSVWLGEPKDDAKSGESPKTTAAKKTVKGGGSRKARP